MQKTDSWKWLRDLEFISIAFSWLFLLMSRLAEPCMSIAALYLIIEAGIPAIAHPVIQNLAEGALIAAPEIILPGAFVVAAQEKAKENANAWLLYVLSWLFVCLTAVTLLSLFVVHFNGPALAILMCARCTAGVGYSILIRVVTHSHPLQGDGRQSVQPVQDNRLEALTEQITTLTASLSEVHQTVINLTQNNQFMTPCTPVSIPSVQIVQEVDNPVQERIDSPVQIVPLLASQAVYPDVQGFSEERVRQVIDLHLQGTAWSKIPGNYSRDVKPIKEAWERVQADRHPVQIDRHAV